MTTKTCKQTIIPQLDETLHKCDDCGYISTDCVVTDVAIPYLSIISGTSLAIILRNTVNRLIKVGSRLALLESYYKPTIVTTTNYTIKSTDTTIYFKPTSIAGTATLPTPNITNLGKKIIFINHSGDTKTIGLHTIDSSTTATTIGNDEVLTLQSIDNKWIKI